MASGASAVVTTRDLLDKVVSAARYYGKLRLIIVLNTGEEEEEEVEEKERLEREVRAEVVNYVEMISSPVSSWPPHSLLRPFYLQSPALLYWRGDSHGDFTAFSHNNIISGVKELDKCWADSWAEGGQVTSLGRSSPRSPVSRDLLFLSSDRPYHPVLQPGRHPPPPPPGSPGHHRQEVSHPPPHHRPLQALSLPSRTRGGLLDHGEQDLQPPLGGAPHPPQSDRLRPSGLAGNQTDERRHSVGPLHQPNLLCWDFPHQEEGGHTTIGNLSPHFTADRITKLSSATSRWRPAYYGILG